MTRRLHTLTMALFALSLAAPVAAQDTAPEDPLSEGLNLFERGAELFLRGLMEEIAPELEKLEPRLRDLTEGMGPVIARLAELIDEVDAYHAPERLPNGDIILRRKEPSEMPRRPLDPPAEGEVDI
ncbi:MAG: hypothetical protein AAF646_09830 [Pseudomonadota bacterium]